MPAPKNARTADRGGRTYTWPPTGEDFASVTTLLQALAKPALVYWSAKMVAEGAIRRQREWLAILEEQGTDAAVRWLKGLPWDKRDRAADAGSTVHAAIEAEIKQTEPPKWPKALDGYRVQFERFGAAYQPQWISSEATVYSRTHGYAGTLDWTAIIGGILYLGDLKTGERVYDEVALQLAAYRHAEWIDLGDGKETPMPPVEDSVVLHLRPDAYYLRPVQTDQAMFEAFLAVAGAWRWQQAVAKVSTIGEMVMPTVLVAPAPSSAPSLDELLVGAA
jgi:hypothetical protein